MSFTNLPIDTDQLPRAGALDWTPMPSEHRREVQVQSLITVGALALLAWVQGVSIPYPEAWSGVFTLGAPALVLLVGAAITWITLKKVAAKGWALREHDIAFRSGLFWRKVVLLPFNRIQHAEVSHGPLQRRFGVATLKFFTAGGRSVDLKIEGLLGADAERLREHVLERSALARETE